MLKRPITTIELIQLNKMFSSGRGYKDLIRDFEKCFNLDLPKQKAKEFMVNRSWSEVLEYLTGDKIEPDEHLDHIEEQPIQRFELLEQMLKLNQQDEAERLKELDEFESSNYYIPATVKFFNLPLFGEIITYRHREPFIKCFLFTNPKPGQRRQLEKIEDVPISDKIPPFLLRIIRKINESPQEVEKEFKDFINDKDVLNSPNFHYLRTTEDIKAEKLQNILDCPLFQKYNIVAKT